MLKRLPSENSTMYVLIFVATPTGSCEPNLKGL